MLYLCRVTKEALKSKSSTKEREIHSRRDQVFSALDFCSCKNNKNLRAAPGCRANILSKRAMASCAALGRCERGVGQGRGNTCMGRGESKRLAMYLLSLVNKYRGGCKGDRQGGR